jgi:O-antigen/teichoic acid export membrane protein
VRRVTQITSAFADSGFAALTNFGAGLFAVTQLSTTALALYSLLFAGWVTSQVLPAQMVYFPARLELNLSGQRAVPRVSYAPLRRRWPVFVAPIVAVASGIPLFTQFDQGTLLLTCLSVALLAVLAPLNAHLRATLHVLSLHSAAAASSFAGATVSVSVLAFAAALGQRTFAESPWVPLLVLAVANGLGLVACVWHLRRLPKVDGAVPGLRSQLQLVGPELASQVSNYVLSLLTLALLGVAAVASLEAARVVVSPIFVLLTGFASFYLPKALASLRSKPRQFLNRMSIMSATSLALGAAYAVLLLLLPQATHLIFGSRVDVGLASARAGVAALEAAAGGISGGVFALGRGLAWNGISVATAVTAPLVLAVTAGTLGVYSVPLAQAVSAIVKGIGGHRLIRAGQKSKGS